MRLVDGALIIVDAVEGIMAQTRTVIRQAVHEKLKLILFINKIDRLIVELNLPVNKIKDKIERILGEVNSILLNFGLKSSNLPKFQNGSILMGSALDGWAIDHIFIKNGGSFEQIIDYYTNKDKNNNLLLEYPISQVLVRSIIKIIPEPKIGQIEKINSLLTKEIDEKLLNKIQKCSPTEETIALIGRFFKIQNTNMIGYMIRVVSGTIKKNKFIKSASLNEKIKIKRIFTIYAKSVHNIDELKAGQIGGIVLSRTISPGDIIYSHNIKEIKIQKIYYVQEPVVAVSIEPKKINKIKDLHNSMMKLAEITPGLIFEANPETGELLALGVGTLQLEIMKSNLIEMGFDVEVSNPKILTYEMATRDCEFLSSKYKEIKVYLSNIKQIKKISIYEDHNNNNSLYFLSKLSSEFTEGFIEVFRQYMRLSPISSIRIKNFNLVIKLLKENKTMTTYENGIIIGSALIKETLKNANSKIHEPFYTIELNTPKEFVGALINELQKSKTIIEELNVNKPEAYIKALIPVKFGMNISDNLRQITDGNIFWSFPSIKFLPIT